jgi:Na+-translocating ferredoxin:NAD+ oxidoreductase RnfG subunit
MKLLKKLPEIILLVILFSIIAKQSSNADVKDVLASKTNTVFNIEEAKTHFEEAKEINIISIDKAEVLNDKGEKIAYMLSTSPIADKVIGYAGKVPVLIVIDNKEEIKAVKLLANYETPHFIRKINKKDFFSSWNTMSVNEALGADVDMVSGASMTTRAVSKGVQLRLAKYLEMVQLESAFPWSKLIAFAASMFVLVFALLSFCIPKSFAKKRIFLLIASVIILGFWQGELISLALMYGWLINGIPVLAKVLMLIMLSLAFVLPLFMNKSFYCAHVCPYGAAQELMGKLNKKKFKIPSKLIKCLKYIKMVFFYAIVLAVILKFEFDLASLEPFSAFLVSVASPMVIVLATVFLIISIFVPKAWCNYFCPTGYLLDVFRKGKI